MHGPIGSLRKSNAYLGKFLQWKPGGTREREMKVLGNPLKDARFENQTPKDM